MGATTPAHLSHRSPGAAALRNCAPWLTCVCACRSRKARGDVFLDQLEARLNAAYPSATVLRMAKPTFTKPAPAEFLDEVAETCDVAIEALAD